MQKEYPSRELHCKAQPAWLEVVSNNMVITEVKKSPVGNSRKKLKQSGKPEAESATGEPLHCYSKGGVRTYTTEHSQQGDH